METKITLFTEPSLSFSYRVQRAVKRWIKQRILHRPVPKYAGHYAVVRSLIDGLEQIGQPYNLNPSRVSDIAPHVHVLANPDTLRMAVRMKRSGKIRTLTAGPNIVVSSAEEGGLVGVPEIDRYFVNSEWVKAVYELDNPRLKGRLGIWPAGIDAEAWRVEKRLPKKPVAAFYKKRPEHFLYERAKAVAQKAGYDVREILYGSYTPESMKETLAEASVAVYFVEQESQGIALQEIWATDTPTLVWNPQIWMYGNVNYACCSAPYLTEHTGAFFRDESEFVDLIRRPTDQYSPRKWVLEHMTDALCAADFIRKTIGGE